MGTRYGLFPKDQRYVDDGSRARLGADELYPPVARSAAISIYNKEKKWQKLIKKLSKKLTQNLWRTTRKDFWTCAMSTWCGRWSVKKPETEKARSANGWPA